MINYKEMRRIALAPESRFWSLGENVGSAKEPAIYIDNGSKVLAVAHLDTVQNTTHFRTVTIKKPKGIKRTLIFCGQHDDRLGAYIILSLLPELGIKPDVLLTTNEERGQSTAALFTPKKDYNWMFQFDRSGTDVVMYQYKEPRYTKLLEEFGFTVGTGSYSDIADLGHLKVAGFNFGTGYYRNHEETAYAEESEIVKMVTLFRRFWDKNNGLDMPSDAGKRMRYWDYSQWGDNEWVNYRNESKKARTPYVASEAYTYGECEICESKALIRFNDALGCNACDRCVRDFKSSTRDERVYQPCVICQNYYQSEPSDYLGLCPSCDKWYQTKKGEESK